MSQPTTPVRRERSATTSGALPSCDGVAPSGATIDLWCFPHAGGDARSFRRWRREAPVGTAIRGLGSDDAPSTLAELATRHAETIRRHTLGQPERRQVLLGASFGATVAVEVAHRLQDVGEHPDSIIALSSGAPRTVPVTRWTHRLDDRDLLALIERRFGAFPAEVVADPRGLALHLDRLRRDLRLLETHVPSTRRLSCPVRVVVGRDDPSVETGGLAAWSDRTDARVLVDRIDGHHLWFLQRVGLDDRLADWLGVEPFRNHPFLGRPAGPPGSPTRWDGP